MRLAVISDIHGNRLALDAALDDLRGRKADKVVCLGDAIQGGPQPAQVAARLQELDCPVVMGNADAWLLTGLNTSTVEQTSDRQLKVREWSLSQLSPRDIEFIKGFAPTVEIPLESGKRLLCFHGSPTSFDDLLFPETPEEEFQRFLGEFKPAIMTGGHTHIQYVRRLDDDFYFNPGSVGFAYNRHQPEESFHADPWAEYAILTCVGDQLSLEFHRVPFDAQEMVRIIRASGIPDLEFAVAMYRPNNQ